MQPQSDEEVRPVVEALRRLDPLLDIQWNPKAIRTKPASFDGFGRATKLAEYDGRWEVIRYETASKLHADREYTKLLTVTAPDRSGKYPVMVADGAYAPLGEWLVEYMELWDRANRHYIAAMDEVWKEHERAESYLRTDEDAGTQEALEKVYREHGSEYWMGGAQGKTDNAPWLGDSAVRQQQSSPSSTKP